MSSQLALTRRQTGWIALLLADQNGYNFWLDSLNNRNSNNYRAMVCAFITSLEYQRRFSTITTRTNQDCAQ